MKAKISKGFSKVPQNRLKSEKSDISTHVHS